MLALVRVPHGYQMTSVPILLCLPSGVGKRRSKKRLKVMFTESVPFKRKKKKHSIPEDVLLHLTRQDCLVVTIN